MKDPTDARMMAAAATRLTFSKVRAGAHCLGPGAAPHSIGSRNSSLLHPALSCPRMAAWWLLLHTVLALPRPLLVLGMPGPCPQGEAVQPLGRLGNLVLLCVAPSPFWAISSFGKCRPTAREFTWIQVYGN